MQALHCAIRSNVRSDGVALVRVRWPLLCDRTKPSRDPIRAGPSSMCNATGSLLWRSRWRHSDCAGIRRLGTSTSMILATRRFAATASPPPLTVGASSSSSSSSSSESSSGSSRLWRAAMIVCKGLGIWAPALFFWYSVWGGMPFDLLTGESLEDDYEARLERFFDVDRLPEDVYQTEWSSKEQALAKIVEKVLRAPRFADALTLGLDVLESRLGNEDEGGMARPGRTKLSDAEADELAAAVEISYVLPPPSGEEELDSLSSSPRRWLPRVLFAHRGGALAIVTLLMEPLENAKDRDDCWACTSLRGELITARGGESLAEPLCDIKGPLPHGIRYMRL
eukprot:TRINITY_DN28913_c0_g1_i1.p1 TRINITY_DN28913_c0_g1~~TRINITY_DN28913_c0_g1_i1.p1  ORF type:complete len:352 (+),score=59.81 TRINITY_DN28913_c0_g1_i1:45-1058(+)